MGRKAVAAEVTKRLPRPYGGASQRRATYPQAIPAAGTAEEFKRRIKTRIMLPSAETAAMLFWALPASGQITMRKVDDRQSRAETPSADAR